MNRNRKGIMPEITREVYKKVKKFDRQQFTNFCTDLYKFEFEDGAEAGKNSVPGIDVEKIYEDIAATKGIGPKKLAEIKASIENAFGGSCEKMIQLDQFPDKASVIKYLRTEKLKTDEGDASIKDAEMYLRVHLPKESYYQDKIIKSLKKAYPKAFVWKAAAGAYGRSGLPDVCAVIDGRYYGFEVKRPYIGVLSTIQEQTIKQIQDAGGIAAVVCFPEEVIKIVEETKWQDL